MNRLNRGTGLLIVGIAVGAAALLWSAQAAGHTWTASEPVEALLFGVWTVAYDTQAPQLSLLIAAIAIVLFIVAAVARIERRASNRSRRSSDKSGTPLAPKIVMASTRGIFSGPVTVTVLIPAHNEEASLPLTLSSLAAQSHRPARVIVVADNCSDDTVEIARAAGVEVFETVANTEKKAGGLNQVLAEILPGHGPNDIVMVMDADTRLDDGFLEAGVTRFVNDRALMAVGGLFQGEEGHGLLGQFQRNEYTRYARQIRRRRGRVFVLTGTASMFRPLALTTIAENRGKTIPGRCGNVYDTAALTEDNELTIAIKSLGGLMISPAECTVVTELMPDLRLLWRQRLRWQRGALENIGAYGVTSQTFRYWVQQLGIGYSAIALSSFLLLLLVTLISIDYWIWFPFWMGVGTIFIAERVITVWRGGWRARLLAMTILPELLFDLFLNVVYLKGVLDITLGKRASWGNVTPADADLAENDTGVGGQR
ncbi:glycosyltransferase family 2 protein [Nesterenkonia sp. DZ6]|uniref:glycosyltransferase family 2 protein n=1 Tax=Nesterenkonia sp. DZ6 TaxID=2901229 RepID=UPI001F4D07AA|nr:glycosyltransferase family 2 protein [Nesterenkonia sp. DZ6]MCH8559582.1 glycosyltransferase family 2 protein [Nesterenkonia sp. DZ6]